MERRRRVEHWRGSVLPYLKFLSVLLMSVSLLVPHLSSILCLNFVIALISLFFTLKIKALLFLSHIFNPSSRSDLSPSSSLSLTLSSSSLVAILLHLPTWTFFCCSSLLSCLCTFLSSALISFHYARLHSLLYGRPFTCIPLRSHSLPPSSPSSLLLPLFFNPSFPLPVTAHLLLVSLQLLLTLSSPEIS